MWRWGTHGRIDEAADIGVTKRAFRVEAMAQAGCKYIGFGAESASEDVIREMGKGGSILRHGFERVGGFEFPKTMIEGIKRTHDTGIHGNCTWIMGYPGETLRDLQTSVAFMQWQEDVGIKPVNKSMFIATAYPGTELFRDPRVRKKLESIFDILYDTDGYPVFNTAMYKYIKSLDDATKLLDRDGNPVNYSAMPDDIFLQAARYVQNGETEKILEMSCK